MDHRRFPPNLVGARLRFLTHAFTRTHLKIARDMGEEDLSMAGGHLIGFLYRNRERDVFQRDVEEELHITRSSVTSLVKLLEKKGYLVRQSVEQDARLKKLSLTERGTASFERTMTAIRQTEALAVRGLTREQLDQFLAVCDVIQSNLVGKEGEDACHPHHRLTDQGI